MAGLYVHIPFCYSRCGYCDFFKTTRLDQMPGFLESLSAEIVDRSVDFPDVVDTIYFGGGTPSLLKPEFLRDILEVIRGHYTVSLGAEITIECNPDDVTPSYLTALLSMGVNRLSLGFQSFKDEDLKIMGRRHNSKQSYDVLEAASQAGFENIGVDFIYGLPWSSRDSFLENLVVFKGLNVQHLSAYLLSIEKGTSFYKLKAQGGMTEIPDSASFDQYRLLCSAMQDAGFEHYEVSNFCKPGFMSRHNSAYWQGVPYLGFGPGSHSFDGRRRFWNDANLTAYVGKNFKRLHREEVLSRQDLFNERIMLGLRTARGVDTGSFGREFPEFFNPFNTSMNRWCNNGFLYLDGTVLKCYEENWFQVDGIIEDLIILNQ
jgi:oxygen-independent coproporphyrinogen III oxidase